MIDTIDKNEQYLLTNVQKDFPIEEHPFAVLSERTGIPVNTLITSIRSLINDGMIRVFGPVFNPRSLGYTSTLIAIEVENERVAELATFMLDISEITHNYIRDHSLNMWFTITARNNDIMDDIIRKVEKFPGVKRTLNLPIVTAYKINAVFGKAWTNKAESKRPSAHHEPIKEEDIMIVRAIQDDFPIVDRPFLIVADRAKTTEQNVIATVRKWLENGTIRRFGARLNHRRAGYSQNVLTAWKGENIGILGHTFAELPDVSHCYQRATYDDWPYELYAMVHATSNAEMKNNLNRMKALAPEAKSISMKTLHELKKTSMRYFLEDM